MKPKTLESLLDQPSKLPNIPKVTQALLLSFGNEAVSVEEIGRQLSADPALSAKLLRLANSAYFNVSRSIASVDDALRMLGFVMVRNLVLGNSMVAAFKNTPGIQLQQFWRYNLYTACASRWLAQQHEEANTDLAFTVGLLHGIGQLQMHVLKPAELAPLDAQLHVLAPGRAALEQQALGFHHGDVAAELARIWKLPEPIVDALRAVPDPLAAEDFSDAAGWVHLGAWRARAEVLGQDVQAQLDSYPSAIGRRLGLAPNWAPVQQGSAPMPPLSELTEGLEAMLD
jgi:HD-like signal output (HDOD) protein